MSLEGLKPAIPKVHQEQYDKKPKWKDAPDWATHLLFDGYWKFVASRLGQWVIYLGETPYPHDPAPILEQEARPA